MKKNLLILSMVFFLTAGTAWAQNNSGSHQASAQSHDYDRYLELDKIRAQGDHYSPFDSMKERQTRREAAQQEKPGNRNKPGDLKK